MKRFLTLIMLVPALSVVAMSQGGTCKDCPASRIAIESAREARAADIAAHNDWPTRPQPSPFLFARKYPYGRLNATFIVTNDAAKKVKQITWQCTLVHLDNKAVISTYTVVSKISIRPHQEATLKTKLWVPLGSFYGPKVVVANNPTPPVTSLPDVVQAEQQNEIKEIRYADGSVVRP